MTKKEKIKWVNSIMEDIGMTRLSVATPYHSLVWDEDNKMTWAIKYSRQNVPTEISFADLPKKFLDLIIADLKEDFD